MLKYNIDNRLNQIPNSDYPKKLAELIERLGVARGTFHDWRHLTIKDTRDIPVGKLMVIADYFDCEMEDLINYEVKEKELVLKK